MRIQYPLSFNVGSTAMWYPSKQWTLALALMSLITLHNFSARSAVAATNEVETQPTLIPLPDWPENCGPGFAPPPPYVEINSNSGADANESHAFGYKSFGFTYPCPCRLPDNSLTTPTATPTVSPDEPGLSDTSSTDSIVGEPTDPCPIATNIPVVVGSRFFGKFDATDYVQIQEPSGSNGSPGEADQPLMMLQSVSKGEHAFLTLEKLTDDKVHAAGYSTHPDDTFRYMPAGPGEQTKSLYALRRFCYVEDRQDGPAFILGARAKFKTLRAEVYYLSHGLCSSCFGLDLCPRPRQVKCAWGTETAIAQTKTVTVDQARVVKGIWDGVTSRNADFDLSDPHPPNNYNFLMHFHQYLYYPSSSVADRTKCNAPCYPINVLDARWGHDGYDGGWREQKAHRIYLANRIGLLGNPPAQRRPNYQCKPGMEVWDICTGRLANSKCNEWARCGAGGSVQGVGMRWYTESGPGRTIPGAPPFPPIGIPVPAEYEAMGSVSCEYVYSGKIYVSRTTWDAGTIPGPQS